MRENRTHGSEGGESLQRLFSTPIVHREVNDYNQAKKWIIRLFLTIRNCADKIDGIWIPAIPAGMTGIFMSEFLIKNVL